MRVVVADDSTSLWCAGYHERMTGRWFCCHDCQNLDVRLLWPVAGGQSMGLKDRTKCLGPGGQGLDTRTR